MNHCDICGNEEINEIFKQNNVCSAKCNRKLLDDVSQKKGQTKLDELRWISS